MAEMKVIRETSVQETQRFTGQVENDKIRGRDNGDGVFTLYTSAKGKGSGFKEFFGMLDGRRQAVRDAIDMVMHRVDSSVSVHERTRTGYSQARSELAGGFHARTSDIRGDAFTEVVNLGEKLFRESGTHLPVGMNVDGSGALTGSATLTSFQRTGGRVDADAALTDGGESLINPPETSKRKPHDYQAKIGEQVHTFKMPEITYADFSRLNIHINGENTNCSNLGGSKDQRFIDKMESNLTNLRATAGTDNAASVLSSVLNQNMLSILHKGLTTPDADLITLTQKKKEDLGATYTFRDSTGDDHVVNELKQYSNADIRVTTEPNGDFRVTVDWPMYFNSVRKMNEQKQTNSEMNLTPNHDRDRVQLCHTTGSFVISKNDADQGVLNLHVDVPFNVEFDGNIR